MQYKVHYPYLTFIIDAPLSIDDFFSQMHLSKKTIHFLKQNKDYTVNKRYVSSSTILLKGDLLTIKAFQEDDGLYSPCYQEIEVLYEDELILVVNKPPFLNVFPDSQEKTDSLAHRVSAYYQQCGYNIPVRYIHRLDYETSGAVLFCKCALIQPLLDFQLSQKLIQRKYMAIVEGEMKGYRVHSIRQPIARDRHHNQRMRVSKTGKEARTDYQLIASQHHLSLIECQLYSGRKHQIRVHMAFVGHSLLGDKLYSQSSHLINRQALHAYWLSFEHPITKEKVTIVCRPPEDMQRLIDMIDPKC